MEEQLSREELEIAARQSDNLRNCSYADRLEDIDPIIKDHLGRIALLNGSLSIEGIRILLGYDSNICTVDEVKPLVLDWITKGVLTYECEDDKEIFSVPDDLCIHFEKELSPEKITKCHRAAEYFFINYLTGISIERNIKLPDDPKELRRFLIGPNGVLDSFLHHPEEQALFNSMICAALSLQGHLFCLGQYTESSNIANMVCFALSRQGQRPAAKKLLLQSISVTKGLPNLVSRVNLGTLLREENDLDTALRIYRGALPGLFVHKAKIQIAQVYGEIGSIYRQKGNYLAAAFYLEICNVLDGWMHNGKSQAVVRSQTASLYLAAKLFPLALLKSRQAVVYFRNSSDYLNLGRSLLTRGNVFYRSHKFTEALRCFDEALSIGNRISDPQAICGSMSGRARVFMAQNNLAEVKQILDEVISIRQRNSDHSIGIEFQNMGQYYELSGNASLALVWYQKALKSVSQYMPAEVGLCERNVKEMENKISGQRK